MINGTGLHSPQRGLIGPQSWVPHLGAIALDVVNGTDNPESIDLIQTAYNSPSVHSNIDRYSFFIIIYQNE